jgi:hypothetical protein
MIGSAANGLINGASQQAMTKEQNAGQMKNKS